MSIINLLDLDNFRQEKNPPSLCCKQTWVTLLGNWGGFGVRWHNKARMLPLPNRDQRVLSQGEEPADSVIMSPTLASAEQ